MTMDRRQQASHWRIEDARTRINLVDAVKGAYKVHMCPTRKQSVVYYDSFPWQLWFSGNVLYREGDRLCLRVVSKKAFGQVLAETDIQGETPCFYWDFPENMRALLKPQLKLRALIEKASYIRSETVYEIKNDDQKTVSRLVIRQYRHSERGKIFLIMATAQPVRGYQKDFSILNKLLDKQGLKRSVSSPLHTSFKIFNSWPQSYSPKPLYHPHGAQTTQEEILESVLESWENARMCEFGIVKDLDIEFLHDYRVCLRSIRAILRRIKGALSPVIQTQLAELFADLGTRTNRLRDLDVYLLKESRYKAMVPRHLSETFEDMFSDYRNQRESELKKLTRYFGSKAYANQAKRIESLIERGRAEKPTEIGLQPINEVAYMRLKKQYRKVIRLGRELHHGTADSAIHQLRLECKKLRYLLEYFSPMFERKAHAKMVRSMKELQDTLGIFNDLSVQQGSLQEYYASSNSGNPLLGVAIGVLIGSMHRDQKKMRKKVVKMFDVFDSRKMHRQFREMMRSQAGDR